jgi:hypothetical protein
MLVAALVLFLIAVLVLTIWPDGSAVITAPHKPERAAAIGAAAETPAYLVPPPDVGSVPPPPPRLDSPQLALPSSPDMMNSTTSILDASEAQQSYCRLYGYLGYCWTDFSAAPATCLVDHQKRAVAMTVVFPQYKYEVPLYPSRGSGTMWFRIWSWNADTNTWVKFGWSHPITQYAHTHSGEPIVFRQTHWQPSVSDLLTGGQWIGYRPLVWQLQGAINSGHLYYVIEGYVRLNQGDDPPINRPIRYWRFNNGTMYCGYNFRASAQSDTGAAVVPSSPKLTSGPPTNDNPPAFLYLPLVKASGTSTGEPTPTPTPNPTLPAPPTPAGPPTTQGLVNPNFDAGPGVGWTEYSSEGYPVVMAGPKGFGARSGQYLAWLGGAHNDVSRISQAVTVPNSHPFLSLYMMATSQEDLCNYDRAAISVNEYQVATIGLCKPYNFHAWLKSQIDLREFAGQTVTITIQVETDSSLLSSLFIDDLAFESGVFIPTPVPSPSPPSGDAAIRNPGFELGNNGDWGSHSSSGYNNIFLHDGAHSGRWLAWLGGANNEVGYIDQVISIPSDRPYLTYWGWISSAESTCGGDQVSFIVGATAVFGYNLCSANNSSQWGRGWVNLSAYAGTTQTIRIRVQTNGALISSLYLDDFAFAASPPTSSALSESGGQPSEFNASAESTGVSPSGLHNPATEPGRKDKTQ